MIKKLDIMELMDTEQTGGELILLEQCVDGMEIKINEIIKVLNSLTSK